MAGRRRVRAGARPDTDGDGLGDKLAGGLLGHWKLDEAVTSANSVPAADLSSNANHGTLDKGYYRLSNGITEGFVEFTEFDPQDQQRPAGSVTAEGGTPLAHGFDPLAISLWVRIPDAGTLQSSYRILELFDTSTGAPRLSIAVDPSAGTSLSSPGTATIAAGHLADGRWHHIALTRDVAGVLYIDGVQVASSSVFLFLANADRITLGDPQTFHDKAAFDDLRIYDRTLTTGTDGEIEQIQGQRDEDKDGLPDDWEQRHFGDLRFTASDDPDGDGADNAEELGNRTHPRIAFLLDDAEGPVITEFMTSNSSFVDPAGGGTPDWIEIHNPTAEPIDLSDWLLDDWNVSGDTFSTEILQPGAYLVIFGPFGSSGFSLNKDNEEDPPAGQSLHDTLTLFDPQGNVRQEFEYPNQHEDRSYGLGPAHAGIGFMAVPTPGAPNAHVVDGSFSLEPTITPERGVYTSSSPQEVTLASTEQDARIYYTTDGSIPSPDNPQARLYTEPFDVCADSATTIVRAVSFAPAKWASPPITHTYLNYHSVIRDGNPDPVTQQRPHHYPDATEYGFIKLRYDVETFDDAGTLRYPWSDVHADLSGAEDGALVTANGDFHLDPGGAAYDPDAVGREIPTISITMDVEDLFGTSNGIYANAMQKGEDWERAASFEWIDPTTNADPSDHHQKTCSIRIHGGSSRRPDVSLKHSFRLIFDGGEHSEGKLSWNVFDYHNDPNWDPQDPSNIDDSQWFSSFSELLLKTPTHDSWAVGPGAGDTWTTLRENATYANDQFATAMMRKMGYETPRRRWAHLYLNGLYWGIYEIMEEPDEPYVADRMPDPAPYYEIAKPDEIITSTTIPVPVWDELFTEARALRDEEALIGTGAYEAAVNNYIDKVEDLLDPSSPDWKDYSTYGDPLQELLDDLETERTAVETEKAKLDSLRTRYQAVEDRLDLDQFIDYLILNIYMMNTDWPQKNYRAIYAPIGGGASRYRFHMWDAEWSLVHSDPSADLVDRINGDYGGPGELYSCLKAYRVLETADPAAGFVIDPAWNAPAGFGVWTGFTAGFQHWDFDTALDFESRFQARAQLLLSEDLANPDPTDDVLLNSESAGTLYRLQSDNVRRALRAEAVRWGIGSPDDVDRTTASFDLATQSIIGDPASPDFLDGVRITAMVPQFFGVNGVGGNIYTESPAAEPPTGNAVITAYYPAPVCGADRPIVPRDSPYRAPIHFNTLVRIDINFTGIGFGNAVDTPESKMTLTISGGLTAYASDCSTPVVSTTVTVGEGTVAPGDPYDSLYNSGGMTIWVEIDGNSSEDEHTVSIELDGETLLGTPGSGFQTKVDINGDDMVILNVPQSPCENHYLISESEATGPKFRKIALNGLPFADEKPQAEEETDQEPEETYIDALTLQLNHETTDVYVPLVGGDLALAVRRNAKSEVWRFEAGGDLSEEWQKRGERPHQYVDRPFGIGWSSGLSPNIRFAFRKQIPVEAGKCPSQWPEPDYVHVTDENGSVHRFLPVWTPGYTQNNLAETKIDSGNSANVQFVPIPSNRTEQEAFMTSLHWENVPNDTQGRFIFRRKFGTTLVFDNTTDELFRTDYYSDDANEAEGDLEHFDHIAYARIDYAVDRFGNVLDYEFDQSNQSLIPNRIVAYTDQDTVFDPNAPGKRTTTLELEPLPQTDIERVNEDQGLPGIERMLVRSVTDPRGHTYRYDYASIDYGDSDFSYLTAVHRPDGSAVRYQYEMPESEFDNTPRRPPEPQETFSIAHFFHFNLESVTDGNGNTTVFRYTKDYSKQNYSDHAFPAPGYYFVPGQPRIVSSVERPIGTSHFLQDSRLPVHIFYTSPENDPLFYPSVGGERRNYVTDAEGHTRIYEFGDPDLVSTEEFKDWLFPRLAQPTNHAMFLVRWQELKITYPVVSPKEEEETWATEIYRFDPDAGMAVSQVTDFSGNVTKFDYEDIWKLEWVNPVLFNFLGANLAATGLFSGHYYDPTIQQNALFDPGDPLKSQKHFEYLSSTRLGENPDLAAHQSAASRVMTRISDEEGRITVYGIDEAAHVLPGLPRGLRTSEMVFENAAAEAAGTPVIHKTFSYLDPRFPAFQTEQRVLGESHDPGQPNQPDLVTRFEADAYGNVAKTIAGSGDVQLVTRAAYDPNGNKTDAFDGRNNLTRFVYDKRNRLRKVLLPATGEGEGEGTGAREIRYDGRGNKTTEIDENGVHTFFVYDALNRLIHQIRDMAPDGGEADGTFDVSNPYDPQSDDPDLVTTFAYNLVGSTVSTKDPRGNASTTIYDAIQRPIETRDALNNLTQFRYVLYEDEDGDGDGEFEVDPSNPGSSAFDVSGFKPVLTVDPRGYTSTATYDALYRPTQTTVQWSKNPDQFGVTNTAYDAVGNVRVVTDPLGKSTVTFYDALDRPTDVFSGVDDDKTDILAGSDVGDFANHPFKSTTKYTSTGLALAVTDAEGNTTSTEYDSAGRPIRVIAPESWSISENGHRPEDKVSPVTETVYDNARNVKATISPRGLRTDFEYDERNRRTVVIGPTMTDAEDGLEKRPGVETAYDQAGNVVSVTDAREKTTTTEYDNAYRAVSVETPIVPIFGQPDASITTSTEYDRNGNIVSATDGEGNITRNTYDALNRLITTRTDPVNPDPATDAATNIIIENFYDEAGNLIAVVDGEGRITNFSHDGLNRQTQIAYRWEAVTHPVDRQAPPATILNPGADANRNLVSFAYDAVNKIHRKDAEGRVTKYAYDDLHRLTDVTYMSPNVQNPESPGAVDIPGDSEQGADRDLLYTYDNVGNILSVTLPDHASPVADVHYVYDDLYRVVRETSAGVTHAYEYDAEGNRRRMFCDTDATGSAFHHRLECAYDSHNRLLLCSEYPFGSPDPRITIYAYDRNGNIRSKTLPNGVATACVYDDLDRKTSATSTTGGGGLVQGFAYQYDRNGNVRFIDEDYAGGIDSRTVTNTYDRVLRLTSEEIDSNGTQTATNYGYDRSNNRTLRDGSPFTYNNFNQLASHGAVALSYDANGNRASRTLGAGADIHHWDYENRLISLVKTTAGGGGGVHAYLYDYRARRVVRDESSAGGKTTHLTFSGGTSVQEFDADTGLLDVTFVRGSDYGGGVGGMLYSLRPDGSGGENAAYAISNSRGDVTAQTDELGAATWQAAYEAFGTRTDETGAGGFADNWDRQRANTKDEDPTGLLNEGFRYRDLEAGVFISRDPAGMVDGPNLYTYVRQNPWSAFDPSGLAASKVLQSVAKGVIRKGSNAYSAMNRTLREIYGSGHGLFQVHHAFHQKLYTDPKLGKFLKKTGFEKNSVENMVVLPTKKGREIFSKQGKDGKSIAKMTVHEGKHTGDYFQRITNKVKQIHQEHADELIDQASATKKLQELQQETIEDLINGKIRLQNYDKWGTASLYGLAVVVQEGSAAHELLLENQRYKEQLARINETYENTSFTNLYGHEFMEAADVVNPAHAVGIVDEVVTNFDHKTRAHKIRQKVDPIDFSAGVPGCFVKGTLVCLESGHAPIERLRIGDRVKSFDHEDGVFTLSTVIQTHVHSAESLLAINVGTETIYVSSEHPFFLPEKDSYVPAIELKPGDRLKSNSNKIIRVGEISTISKRTTVYNITVDDNRNYLITPDEILVHNKQ